MNATDNNANYNAKGTNKIKTKMQPIMERKLNALLKYC